MQKKLKLDRMYIPQAAQDWIEARLQPTDVAWEFGSGGSTLWLAQHVCKLTTVEHVPEWHAAVQRRIDKLNKRGMLKGRLVTNLLEPDLNLYPKWIRKLTTDHPLDFVFIDGRERLRCTRLALLCVRPGGVVVVDNTDAPKYREVYTYMEQQPEWRQVGQWTGIAINPKNRKDATQAQETTAWEHVTK